MAFSGMGIMKITIINAVLFHIDVALASGLTYSC